MCTFVLRKRPEGMGGGSGSLWCAGGGRGVIGREEAAEGGGGLLARLLDEGRQLDRQMPAGASGEG